MWDDLRVSADMIHFKGAQESVPPQARQYICHSERGPSYSGLQGRCFDRGREGRGLFQSGFFHAQLPHTYQEGTALEPHFHCRLLPGDEAEPGQALLLEFEYTWLNVGETVPVSTKIISKNYTVSAEDMTRDNVMISFGMIEKTDARISSMLSCRFSRITIDPDWKDYWGLSGLENDSFQGGLLFYEFDFHFEKDSAGSREIYTK